MGRYEDGRGGTFNQLVILATADLFEAWLLEQDT